MKANAEPLEGNKVKLVIELDESEVDKAVEEAFKKIARQVNIPGFRPGKAPRKLIEARVGADAARAQALNDSLPDHYMNALGETDTDAIAPPEIEITEGAEDGPVTFEAVVEVRPVPNLAGYEGLQVTIPNPQPSDDEVDRQIDRMRAQYSELEEVDRPASPGDFVTIDIAGEHEGEAVPGLTASDYSYEVGTGLQSLGEEFDSKIAGTKAGDTIDFTAPVPPDGEEVAFHVEVKTVNERKLPEVTDEWANEVSEFETVEELRRDIAERLAEVRKSEASRALRGAVVEAVAELVEDDIPDSLVATEVQRQLQEVAFRLQEQGFTVSQYLEATGQPQEEFLGQLREAALPAVRADLALRALADKLELVATDQDVDEEIEHLAAHMRQKAPKVRRQLERNDQLPAVRSDIRKAKAVQWLVENVDIVDSEGRSVDRSLLVLDDPSHNHADHNHLSSGNGVAGESDGQSAQAPENGESES